MDWYEDCGMNDISGLQRVRLCDDLSVYGPQASHFALLRNLYRQGSVLWPEDGNFESMDYKDPARTWNVIIYHNSVEAQDVAMM